MGLFKRGHQVPAFAEWADLADQIGDLQVDAYFVLADWVHYIDDLIECGQLREKYSLTLAAKNMFSIDEDGVWTEPSPSAETEISEIASFLTLHGKVEQLTQEMLNLVRRFNYDFSQYEPYYLYLISFGFTSITAMNSFLLKSLIVAYEIHCEQNSIIKANYGRLIDAKEGFTAMFDSLQREQEYWQALRGFRRFISPTEEMAHSTMTYGYISALAEEAIKYEKKCHKILPWILGEVQVPDFSDF